CALVEERRHLFELLAVFLVTQALSDLELAWRYFTLIRPIATDDLLESAFNHDGSILVGFLTVICAAYLLCWPNKKAAGAAGLMLALPVFLTLATRRRAAVLSTEMALMTLGFMLLLSNRRRFFTILPVLLVVGVVYTGVFWNNNNSWGQ